MTFSIRLARAEDAARLPAIERAACARFARYGLAEVMGELATSVEEHLAGVRDGGLFVAEVDGAIVGFALAVPLGGALHLDELDVLPAFGRRGIGRALVSAVVELARARGLPAVTLSTLRNIPWNAPFYARLGFRILDDADLTPALRALLDEEFAEGFPMEDRVLMQRPT